MPSEMKTFHLISQASLPPYIYTIAIFTDDDTRLLEIWVTNVCCRAQWHLMVLIAGISSNGILMHTTNLLLAFLFHAKLTLHVISCISTYWTLHLTLYQILCRYSIQLTDYCLCNQKNLEIPNIPTFHSISIRYNVMTGDRCI